MEPRNSYNFEYTLRHRINVYWLQQFKGSVTIVVRRRNCEKKRLPKNRYVRNRESQRDSGEGEGSTIHVCDPLRHNPEAYDPQPHSLVIHNLSPDHAQEANLRVDLRLRPRPECCSTPSASHVTYFQQWFFSTQLSVFSSISLTPQLTPARLGGLAARLLILGDQVYKLYTIFDLIVVRPNSIYFTLITLSKNSTQPKLYCLGWIIK